MALAPNQQTVLSDLTSLGLSPVDVWQGSHVIVTGDHGALYDKWKNLSATPRTSSHYPGVHVQQYEIDFGQGTLVLGQQAFLFGETPSGDTWFQMEHHAGGDLVDIPGHLKDYFKSLIAGQNVGPLGLSPHTETQSPIQVAYRATT